MTVKRPEFDKVFKFFYVVFEAHRMHVFVLQCLPVLSLLYSLTKNASRPFSRNMNIR